MKFGITKFEQFALTSHLVGLRSPNPEHGRMRLRAWDELGVALLADQLAIAATLGGVEIRGADWMDKVAAVDVELTADVVRYVLNGLGAETAGVWADTLTRLRERLERPGH